MNEIFDVVIVGGAVTGSAAAYFLASHPDFDGRVLVLEADPSYQYCATTRSAASIRHQFSTPENVRMSMYGTEFLRQIGEHLQVGGEAPEIGLVEAGYLFLATAAGSAVLAANHGLQTALGADLALLGRSQLQDRFPWLASDDLERGCLGLSGEGWFDAHALMMGLRRKARSLGVEYRQARVTALLSSHGKVHAVQLADGSTIACDRVINAAGTGAAALARSVGINLPVQSRKRCVFHFRSPAQLGGCPLVIDPSGLYFRPEGAGFICGIAPAEADDPECHDFEVPAALFEEQLWPALARRVPGFEAARLLSSWAGHYDVNTLDHNLILGEHPDQAGLLFANGFSGHGLQQSPAVGRALAELVVYGGYRSLDLSAFGWQRVILGQPLLEVNVV